MEASGAGATHGMMVPVAHARDLFLSLPLSHSLLSLLSQAGGAAYEWISFNRAVTADDFPVEALQLNKNNSTT